jgi:hypothetical protein
VSSRPRPPERRRLETNCGLRSRAASELTDRSLPKRSRPAAFIGPSSSLPSWTGLHATTSDAGGRSSSLTAGAFDSTLPRKQQFGGLSREPGTRAKLIPQDWMTNIPEKTPLVLLMRGGSPFS